MTLHKWSFNYEIVQGLIEFMIQSMIIAVVKTGKLLLGNHCFFLPNYSLKWKGSFLNGISFTSISERFYPKNNEHKGNDLPKAG